MKHFSTIRKSGWILGMSIMLAATIGHAQTKETSAETDKARLIYDKSVQFAYQSFTARTAGLSDVVLHWSMINSLAEQDYILERSTDGINYTPIGEVLGATVSDYTVHDYTPIQGTNYYRLHITSVETADAIGKPTLVKMSEAYTKLYPVPANDFVMVESNDGLAKTAIINNFMGTVLMTIPLNGNTRIDLSALTPGRYTVNLSNGKSYQITKQ